MNREVSAGANESIHKSGWERFVLTLSSLVRQIPLDILIEVRKREKGGFYNDSFPSPRFDSHAFDGSPNVYWEMIRGMLVMPEKE